MFEALKRYRLRRRRATCLRRLTQSPEQLIIFCQFLEGFQKLKMDRVSDHFLMTKKISSLFPGAKQCLDAIGQAQQVLAKEQRFGPEGSTVRNPTGRYLDEWLADWPLAAFHQELTLRAILLARQLITSRARGDKLYPYYQRKLHGYFLEVLKLSATLLEAY